MSAKNGSDGPDAAETMRLLRLAAEDWKKRAQAEAAAGAHWRLLAATLLARVPGRFTEVTLAEVGALRAEGLSIDEHETPDGSYVVRLYKPEDEAPPPPQGAKPTPDEPAGTPCATTWPRIVTP